MKNQAGIILFFVLLKVGTGMLMDNKSEHEKDAASNTSWKSDHKESQPLPVTANKQEEHCALTFNVPTASLKNFCSRPDKSPQNVRIPEYYQRQLERYCERKVAESEKLLKQSLFHEASVRMELEQRFLRLENTSRFMEKLYKETVFPQSELLQHILNRLHLEKMAREDLQAEVNRLQQRLQVSEAMIDCEYVRRPGVYNLRPLNKDVVIPVYCERGWTVIQRRATGAIDFYRNWDSYANGFGDFEGEFWLGNNNIHLISTQGKYRLQVEMTDWEGETFYSEYHRFWIDGAKDNYRLHVSGHHGNIKDGLIRKESRHNHNNMPFSTYDQNNQPNKTSYCAEIYHGAWWYNSCYASNLNGQYCNPKTTGVDKAKCMVWWGGNQDDRVVMKTVTMRIRESPQNILYLKEVDET